MSPVSPISPVGEEALRQTLVAAARDDGGWPYYAGKASRIEPTVWAAIALGTSAPRAGAFLAARQRPGGWIVEDPSWPVNIGFNALAAFASIAEPALAGDAVRRPLLDALIRTRGVQTKPSEYLQQNNALQAWPWTDGTFSWVEPTSWALLALKRARRQGTPVPGADERIDEGDRLLIDRACQTGGWNYGNASVMHQPLRAHVPTTALALLALRDRAQEPVVARGLAHLESQWDDEISSVGLGLTLLCLDAYGRPAGLVAERLQSAVRWPDPNLHAVAVALVALTRTGPSNVFRT